jgi:hypothetical protein
MIYASRMPVLSSAVAISLFVAGFSSRNVLYSKSERIPVRYVLAPALAVEQAREKITSFYPLSAFVVQVKECFLNPSSAQVAFIRSHYFARRAEASFTGLLRCLGRHLNPGAVSGV